jgi:hypothetical protein
MSDTSRLDAKELHARLRDLALSWEEGHRLAMRYATETVVGMRKAFNEFAEQDPYEAGKVERWDLSVKDTEPVVLAMTAAFSHILNRRGLLKIDPA